MSPVGDTTLDWRVSQGHEDGDLQLGSERVAEGKHALEVAQSDAAAAVRGEQRSRGHDGTARAAAQAWIRCRARTTSSWSEAAIVG